MIFKVSGSLFSSQKLFKMGSESHLRRGSPQKASWKPLGALLEGFGGRKNKVGIALGRSWGPLKTGFSQNGVQNGTPTYFTHPPF